MRNYPTEEEVEDAFVGYLKSVLPGDLRVVAAMTVEQATAPFVIVTVLSNDNANQALDWNDHRIMEVEIKLGVEAKNVKDGGNVLKTLREQMIESREALLGALTVPDLKQQLIAAGKVNFSQITIGSIRRQTDGYIMETVIPLAVLA